MWKKERSLISAVHMALNINFAVVIYVSYMGVPYMDWCSIYGYGSYIALSVGGHIVEIDVCGAQKKKSRPIKRRSGC